jgi:hypothetical protein
MHGMNQTLATSRWMNRASKPAVLQQSLVSKLGGPVARQQARGSSRCGLEREAAHLRDGERNHARIPTNRSHLRPAAG